MDKKNITTKEDKKNMVLISFFCILATTSCITFWERSYEYNRNYQYAKSTNYFWDIEIWAWLFIASVVGILVMAVFSKSESGNLTEDEIQELEAHYLGKSPEVDKIENEKKGEDS